MTKSVTSVRWTLHSAAQEFGLDDKTLAGKIRINGIVTGADGKFSTLDICKAVFGDIDGEKLRLVREQADSFAIKNSASRRELLNAGEVRAHLERVLIALRGGILSSNLSAEEKDDLMMNLKRLGESIKTNDTNRKGNAPELEDSESASEVDRQPVGQQESLPVE